MLNTGCSRAGWYRPCPPPPPPPTHTPLSHSTVPDPMQVASQGWMACRPGVVGLGWDGTGPETGGDCRPARPSLHGTGPKPWVCGSKAERTGTAPMDHIAVPVCRKGQGGRAGGGGGMPSALAREPEF